MYHWSVVFVSFVFDKPSNINTPASLKKLFQAFFCCTLSYIVSLPKLCKANFIRPSKGTWCRTRVILKHVNACTVCVCVHCSSWTFPHPLAGCGSVVCMCMCCQVVHIMERPVQVWLADCKAKIIISLFIHLLQLKVLLLKYEIEKWSAVLVQKLLSV